MLPNLKGIHFPESLDAAIRLLAEGKGRVRPFSGGVSFVFNPDPRIEGIVCLRNLPLNFIRKEQGGLSIGPTTLIADLIRSEDVKTFADGVIAEAAGKIGSTLNRNLITVGGNLIQPFIWSTLPTVALALGAKFKIKGIVSRVMDADQFYSRMPKNLLKCEELVVEILFPSLPRGSRAVYRQFNIAENDFALLKVAGWGCMDNGVCRELRIAIGGATILPQRGKGVEDAVKGRRPDRRLVEDAAGIAASEMKVLRDMRVKEEYKRKLAAVLITDVVWEIVGGGKSENIVDDKRRRETA